MAGTIPFSSRVVINRRTQLTYPPGMTLIDPELSKEGPPNYDLSELEPWLHHSQRNNWSVSGLAIYCHLKDSGSLPLCLGLQDGLAIKEKGIVSFRRFFSSNDGSDNKTLPLWKSVARHHVNGVLYVPCVFRDGNDVAIGWHSMNSKFYSQDVTFKIHPKNAQGRFSSGKVA